MPDQIRVNIKHRVANSAIRKEERDGREVIVVPSVVAKFNTVLNDIFYGEDELRKSYQQVNGLPAPMGHPVINGQYVSARDPEAINRHWAGAWNANARIDGDVIRADKLIDVETANESERGRRLLQAIEAGEPISTSTGLLMEREAAPEGAEYKWRGMNFAFDHDAILLDEAPAISPEEGVGMMVNGEQVEVVESELNVDDDLLTMMAWEMVERNESDKKRKRNESLVEKVKNAIRGAFRATMLEEEAAGLNVNHQSDGDSEMTVTQEAFDALAAKVDELAANQKQDEVLEAVNGLKAQVEAMNAEREEAAKAEHAAAVEAVVNAKLLDEEEAEAMPTAALNSLVKATKKAAPLAPGMAANSSDTLSQYQLPEGD